MSLRSTPAMIRQSLRAPTRNMPGALKFPGLAGGLSLWTLSSTPPTAAGCTDTSPLRPQIQNLGLFPIHGVTVKITIPIATRGGNRLLMLRDFLTEQVPTPSRAGLGKGARKRPTFPWVCPRSSDLGSFAQGRGHQAFPGERRKESLGAEGTRALARPTVFVPYAGEHVL